MKRASEKAYISKKELALYQKAKDQRKKKTEEGGEDFVMREEEKHANNSDVEEAELSAEEVDSDDLGDDITQTKQQMMMGR